MERDVNERVDDPERIQPYPENPAQPDDRTNEDPGNFKRTPDAETTARDPLDSGRRLNSNQVLVITLVAGLLGGGILALIYL